MDEKKRYDDWLRRNLTAAGKRRTRNDAGLTRRQQKRQPHVEREDKRDEMEAYRERYRLWYETNKRLIGEVATASRARVESPENYSRYEELQDKLDMTNCPEPPETEEYHRSSESRAFWRNFQRIRDGFPGDYVALIEYLRRDSYSFRSGYSKRAVCRILKRAPLSNVERSRLREVLLAYYRTPWIRQESKEYARLALGVDSPEFRDELAKIDTPKARWALERLDQADRMKASREAKETPS